MVILKYIDKHALKMTALPKISNQTKKKQKLSRKKLRNKKTINSLFKN